jgi:repressor LexA
MKKDLTAREKKVLEWIKSYQQDHGGYPTYREIQAALKFNSINSVSQYIKQLAKKGYVELIKNKGYRLAAQERSSSINIPLLGSVQAGNTNVTQEEPETMSFPQEMVPSPQRSFLLRVRGNSMSDAGIHEDDLVIVDGGKEAQLGDVVVALIEGESTVKRLMEKKGKRYLQAESSDHDDIHPEGNWEIQGVVAGLWREF